jgi:hypothetical protein
MGVGSSLALAMAALLTIGFASNSFETLNTTMTFLVSESAYYGRVSSIQQLNWSLIGIAALPIGVLVDYFGGPEVMVLLGFIVAGFWLLIAAFVPAYRNLERPQVDLLTATVSKT